MYLTLPTQCFEENKLSQNISAKVIIKTCLMTNFPLTNHYKEIYFGTTAPPKKNILHNQFLKDGIFQMYAKLQMSKKGQIKGMNRSLYLQAKFMQRGSNNLLQCLVK